MKPAFSSIHSLAIPYRPILPFLIVDMTEPPELDPIQESTPFHVEPPTDEPDEAEVTRLEMAAHRHLAAEWAHRRHEPIGLLFRARRGKERPGIPHFLVFDYGAGRGFMLAFDDRGEVSGVQEMQSQPAPSANEVERAIDLARRDRKVASGLLSSDLVGRAVMLEPDHALAPTRLLHVTFGRRDERLPRVSAIVDLCSERVDDVQFRPNPEVQHHGE